MPRSYLYSQIRYVTTTKEAEKRQHCRKHILYTYSVLYREAAGGGGQAGNKGRRDSPIQSIPTSVPHAAQQQQPAEAGRTAQHTVGAQDEEDLPPLPRAAAARRAPPASPPISRRAAERERRRSGEVADLPLPAHLPAPGRRLRQVLPRHRLPERPPGAQELQRRGGGRARRPRTAPRDVPPPLGRRALLRRHQGRLSGGGGGGPPEDDPGAELRRVRRPDPGPVLRARVRDAAHRHVGARPLRHRDRRPRRGPGRRVRAAVAAQRARHRHARRRRQARVHRVPLRPVQRHRRPARPPHPRRLRRRPALLLRRDAVRAADGRRRRRGGGPTTEGVPALHRGVAGLERRRGAARQDLHLRRRRVQGGVQRGGVRRRRLRPRADGHAGAAAGRRRRVRRRAPALGRHRCVPARRRRPPAVRVERDLRRRAGGRERGGLHRRHVHVLPEARRRDGARRRGSHRRVQVQQRAGAHGRHGPLLHPRRRAPPAAAGCRQAAGPLLQLPGLMVPAVMAVEQPVRGVSY